MKRAKCENACMSTAQQIRTLREHRNLSQEAFAEAIGKSRSLVAAWEAGRKEPGRDSLRAIERVFGVPMAYVLGDASEVKAIAEGAAEVTLLEMFRSADSVTQNSVLHILSLGKSKD
ncbi:helix-turn-helix domain-containing protein [Asaia prunellae]|uniref:helix-turn-helix domain-containing protein n=1 Tax=Asaia prunellae TaxID=610245 RepID=UPI00131EEFB2|nr:helix-turn-helix transcriptional regulator [Asaia prunellae]